jgi:hypothetical protein
MTAGDACVKERPVNPKLEAYIARHGAWITLPDGREEFMLPLDKIQGFLDLVQPGDVPPEKLQHLYLMQAQAVEEIKRQLREQGLDPDTPSHSG